VQPDSIGLPTTIQLDLLPYITKDTLAQRYRIRVAGNLVAEGMLSEPSTISFTLPPALTARRTIVLDFELPTAVESPDHRLLSIGIRRVALSRSSAGLTP
jgi:hypothetical protein